VTASVVDTNVLVVANGRAEQAGPDCVISCIKALMCLKKDGRIVLDDGMRILKEYKARASLSGQPGVGDAFFKWVWDNQFDAERCELVPIMPVDDSIETYEEFPDDPALRGFHADDRKFVAVARASPSRPPVLNAVDSDWWIFREPLERNGVVVKFLCSGQFESDGD